LRIFVGLCCAALALPGAADDDPSALIEEVRLHDSRTERRYVGLLGAQISHPQQVAASIGVIRVRQPEDWDCTTACDFRGPMFQFEPGLAGTQVGLGYGIIVGEKGRSKSFVHRILVGWGAKATILRTYGGAVVDPPDQTYFGVEGEFTITQVNFSLGVMRSFHDTAGEDRWLVTGGIGWGF